MIFIERGNVDVLDGAFVVVDVTGIRTHIPVGGLACIMLEPGARISHAAVALASRVGTLVMWVGEAGVRLYASGQPGGARSDKLLYQAKLALDPQARLKVVQAMYAIRFGEQAPQKRSIDQLRGIEGARVRRIYSLLAEKYGVTWKKRDYDPARFESGDIINQCLSSATSCLYGVCEAAVLAAGYAPALGFIHSGKPLSFVYDIADLFKFDTVVPAAFKIASEHSKGTARGNHIAQTRHACRDLFRKEGILEKIIPTIEDILSAGGISFESAEQGVQPVAFLEREGLGDDGHRS
jgi:CRISPR-associated protein Cas1